MNTLRYIGSLLLCAIPLMVIFVFVAVIPRVRMERRARALLAKHPGAERTSIYLELHSMFADSKQREIDAKVAEMQPQGWTFLRATATSPARSLRTVGGCIKLHFIRKQV